MPPGPAKFGPEAVGDEPLDLISKFCLPLLGVFPMEQATGRFVIFRWLVFVDWPGKRIE